MPVTFAEPIEAAAPVVRFDADAFDGEAHK